MNFLKLYGFNNFSDESRYYSRITYTTLRSVLAGSSQCELVVGRIVETILREIQVKHFVPSVAGVIVRVVDTAEIRVRVGLVSGLPHTNRS